MRIFLDANILVSVLNKEYPLFTYTSRIVSLADTPGFKVYTSPVCLAIAFHFAEKKCGSEAAKQKIAILATKLEIAEVSAEAVKLTVENKNIRDFEDGIEYYAAIAKKCRVIITQDLNDYHFAEIAVMKPEVFLERLLSNKL